MLRWHHLAGEAWFLRATLFVARACQHPNTWPPWLSPSWMEAIGVLPRRHQDGHFFGPRDTFCRAWLAAAALPSPRCVIRGVVLGSNRGGGGGHSISVDQGGRAIDNEVARASLPPHGTWQEAADALPSALPTAARHARATRRACQRGGRLPCCHGGRRGCRLMGGFHEGAAAWIWAAGLGRGCGAADAVSATPAPLAGGCGKHGPGRPRNSGAAGSGVLGSASGGGASAEVGMGGAGGGGGVERVGTSASEAWAETPMGGGALIRPRPWWAKPSFRRTWVGGDRCS